MLFFKILLIIPCFFGLAEGPKNGDDSLETKKSFQERKKEERKAKKMTFIFTSHKPFYILPYTYNSTPSKGSISGLDSVDHAEAKFQFSFKFNIIDAFWNDHFLMSFAYTNLSFWQLYNEKNSAPFRETNHEPEVFLEFHPKSVNAIVEQAYYRLGFVHQSNGQDVPESRSWNRVYIQGIFDFKYFASQLKIWKRIPESKKTTPLAVGGDDNPDIESYLGNFELLLIKKIGESTLKTLWRNNLQSKNNRGSIQVGWSFPLNEKYKGYIQYYNGFGESLIDYNHAVERIGVGLLLADWL